MMGKEGRQVVRTDAGAKEAGQKRGKIKKKGGGGYGEGVE